MVRVFFVSTIARVAGGPAYGGQAPLPPAAKAKDCGGAAIRDQWKFAGLPRLKSHGRSGRDIEATTDSSISIESEGRICLGEMIVTAHLNRPISSVGDVDGDSCPILVQDNLTGCWKDLARDHVSLPITTIRPPPRIHPLRAARAFRRSSAGRNQPRCRQHGAQRLRARNLLHKG